MKYQPGLNPKWKTATGLLIGFDACNWKYICFKMKRSADQIAGGNPTSAIKRAASDADISEVGSVSS